MKRFKEFVNENYENKDNLYINLIWWLEYEHDWDYVESEGMDRHRFDWNNGEYSFWLNSDLTGEGQVPPGLKPKLVEKGIEII